MVRLSYEPALSSADAAPPVLLSFPYGAPHALASAPDATPREGGKLRLDLRQNPSERKRHQCEAMLENDTMRFAGVNYGRDGSSTKAAGTMLIGIHRKGSSTVKLTSAQVFVMRPGVKVPKVSLDPPAFSGAITSGAEYNERKRQLITELGAAKARKKQKAAETGAVRADAVLNADQLKADLAGAASEAAAAPQAALTDRELHALNPSFDLAATIVADAYPRGSFVTDRVWGALDYKLLRAASKSAEGRERLAADKTLFPPFILATLAAKIPSNKEARAHHLRAMLWLTYMLRLNTLHAPIPPDRSGEAEHPDAHRLQLPREAWRQLVDAYTEPMAPREGAPPPPPGAAVKRRITPPLREKLSMHCLCMALVHVCDGRLRCDALAAPLGLTEQKCAFYLKQLGCIIEKVSGDSVATLRLPLQLPKPGRGGPPQRG